MICSNAEHPGGKGAFSLKCGQVCKDLEYDILGGVLRVCESAKHSQRKVENQVPDAEDDGFQRFFVSGGCLFNQYR